MCSIIKRKSSVRSHPFQIKWKQKSFPPDQNQKQIMSTVILISLQSSYGDIDSNAIMSTVILIPIAMGSISQLEIDLNFHCNSLPQMERAAVRCAAGNIPETTPEGRGGHAVLLQVRGPILKIIS